MITVVIADDEKIIRAGIKKILTAAFDQQLELLEAKNGQDAYTLCQTQHVHILITDIRMPVMDGVQLMGKVSTLSVRPDVIVLSGYEEFSYARAAITNGASAYLLKPIDKADFLKEVQKLMDKNNQHKRMQNEEAFKRIINGTERTAHFEIDTSFIAKGVVCMAVYGSNSEHILEDFIKKSGGYILETRYGCTSLLVPEHEAPLLPHEAGGEQLCIGISQRVTSCFDLKKIKQTAFVALLGSFFAGEGNSEHKKQCGLYFFEAPSEEDFDFSRIDNEYEKCVSYMQLLHAEKVRLQLTVLFSFADIPLAVRPRALHYLYTKITLNLFNRFPSYTKEDAYLHAKEAMIENIMQAASLEEWQKYVTDYILYMMSLLKKQNADLPYIKEALDFLNKHFTDPELTMAMVSNYVSVNYTWFSQRFKEHTGLTFNDYVHRLRIAEAKRLLETGRYRIYEVAAKSGFKDPKHFMKTFKEDTGLKPSEWKNFLQKY